MNAPFPKRIALKLMMYRTDSSACRTAGTTATRPSVLLDLIPSLQFLLPTMLFIRAIQKSPRSFSEGPRSKSHRT